MVLTMVPTMAFAQSKDVAQIGEKGYESLKAAFDAVPENTETTVKLLDNINMSENDIATLSAGKIVIFDLNGKSITVDKSFKGRPIVNNGNMTVVGNGTIDSSQSKEFGYGAIDNYGELIIWNGRFSGSVDAHGAAIRNRATGVLTIHDGTYDGATTAVYNEGKTTVHNGSFIGKSCSSCNRDSWGYTIQSHQDQNNTDIIPEFDFYNGEVIGVQGAFSTSAGKSNVYDGTFKTVACDVHNSGASAFYALYIAGESGEVVTHIYGGEFSSVSKAAAYIGNNNDGGMKKDALVYIHGGEFTAEEGVKALSVNYPVGGAEVTGGTFSGNIEDLSEYIPDGYKLNGNNVEPIKADDPGVVAVADGIYYEDLANAISNVKEGSTVQLLANIETTKTITVPEGKDFILDLNKFNITKGETFEGNSLISVNDSKMSITGKGEILAGDINGLRVSDSELDIAGNVTIKTDASAVKQTVQAYGSKITINDDAYIEGYYAATLYNNNAKNSQDSRPSELIVNGGKIVGDPAGIAGNNLQSAGSKITITGGEITADKEGIAIYIPMESTVDIGGDAEITGGTAIEAKMGNITFRDNAVITGTGSWNENEPENGGSSPEGSAFLGSAQMYGANAPGSSNPQYITSPDLNVNILGGTFVSNNGNAITIYNTEKTDKQTVSVNVTGGNFEPADGKGAVRYITVSDNDNEVIYDNETGAYVSEKDKTQVSVSGEAVKAAVNTDGKTTYYTTVNDALNANVHDAEKSVEIFVFADDEINSEGIENEKVKLTTAPGVQLNVTSNVDGMIVKTTTNQDGTKTYELVAEEDFVLKSVTVDADKTTVHQGEKILLEANVVHNLGNVDLTYQWYKDNDIIEGATEKTFEVSESGKYSVTVTAVKTEGETVTSSKEVVSAAIECTVEAHKFTDTWSYDANGHWHACSVCGEKNGEADHTFGDWKVISEATADKDGEQQRACTVCGYAESKMIPATGTTDEPQKPGQDGEEQPTQPTQAVDKVSQTGDDMNIAIPLTAAGLALAAMAAVVATRRRHS